MLDALVPNVLPEPKLCSGLSGIRRFVIQCLSALLLKYRCSLVPLALFIVGNVASDRSRLCRAGPVMTYVWTSYRAAGTACRSLKKLDAAVSNVLEQGGRKTAATLRWNEREASTVDRGHSNPRVASMTLVPEAGQP
jgi:hypothetical protein